MARTPFKTPRPIRQLMLAGGIDRQYELAEMCDVSPRFIGMLLQGDRKSKRIRGRVARILGISPDHLSSLIGP